MLGRVTLDASVVVSASFASEDGSEDTRRFLNLLHRNQTAVVVPTLIRPEIVAAVRRSTGDPDRAKALDESFSSLPGVIFQDLDERIATAAVDIALATGLRGADAVYAATARHFDATLITLDEEQKNRCPADVAALYPSEALEAM